MVAEAVSWPLRRSLEDGSTRGGTLQRGGSRSVAEGMVCEGIDCADAEQADETKASPMAEEMTMMFGMKGLSVDRVWWGV